MIDYKTQANIILESLEDGQVERAIVARRTALAEAKPVSVSLRTNLKLFGAKVWLWVEFDSKEEKSK